MVSATALSKILIPKKHLGKITLHEEAKLCVAFANFLRAKTLEDDLPYIWFHIPNEVCVYQPIFGLKQAWMGRIPGAPDFCFVGKDRSFFIEFKSAKGKQSPAQKIFEVWCQAQKVPYFICTSLVEAEALLEDF